MENTYNERLNNLHEYVCSSHPPICNCKKSESVTRVHTRVHRSFNPSLQPIDSLNEFGSWVRNFMQRFGIGKYLSASKWGTSRLAKIRSQLAKSVASQGPNDTGLRPKTAFQMYDDIKKVAGKDNYSPGEIAVAARTEAARMRTVFQLLKLKEVGIEYVEYIAKTDSKVRDGHKKFHGRIFEVEWLLRPENDQWRIPMNSDTVGGPFNCRCKYRSYIGTPRGRLNNVS